MKRVLPISKASPLLALARTAALTLLAAPLAAQSTTRISVDDLGAEADGPSSAPALSFDGRWAAFESQATNLVPGDTNGQRDIFVVELDSGLVQRVSVSTAGAQANQLCTHPSLSHDGRLIVFHTGASNLVAGDTNGLSDVFVHDRLVGTTDLVSLTPAGTPGNGSSSFGSISADGRCVVFSSLASDLVPGDTNGTTDVFVRDLLSGTTERVSVATGGAEADGYSTFAAISADGRFVAFQSVATNLVPGDGNAQSDVFVRDRLSGTTERVSVSTSGGEGDGGSTQASLSADGRYVAFQSAATNLVAGDGNGQDDVFVHDRQTGATTRVSVSYFGTEATAPSVAPSISGDGHCVAFVCLSDILVAGDSNGVRDVVLRDLASGWLELLSVDSAGLVADDMSIGAVLGADGTRAVFQSFATNLVPGDGNIMPDIFLRRRGPAHPAGCAGDGSLPTACPCANDGVLGHGCANSAVTAGAVLEAEGDTGLDAVTLVARDLLPNTLAIVLQGDSLDPSGIVFGDGVRCVAGALRRLYARHALFGLVSVPGPEDPGLRARAQALGDPLPPGSLRGYQVYYRDPSTGFCSAPAGNTWNISNAVSVQW